MLKSPVSKVGVKKLMLKSPVSKVGVKKLVIKSPVSKVDVKKSVGQRDDYLVQNSTGNLTLMKLL